MPQAARAAHAAQPRAAKKKASHGGHGRPRRRQAGAKGGLAAAVDRDASADGAPCCTHHEAADEAAGGQVLPAQAEQQEAGAATAATSFMVHYSRESALQVPEVFADLEGAARLGRIVLVGQPASSLQGVARLARLTELWLVESQLRDASDARECVLLEKLVLSSNYLAEVPDLAPLSKLHTLWLPGNRITTITNVSHLPALADLNLADNLICSTRGGLAGCRRLAALNLSGNPLASLKELRHLSALQSLRTLTMADPVYGVTPLARLCNYRSCVLLHLPQLRTLDGFSVEPEELAQLKDFYSSGGRHMSMLRRHAEARYMLAVRRLGKTAATDLQRLRDQFFHLGQQRCEIQHQRMEELGRQLRAQSAPAKPRGYLQRLAHGLAHADRSPSAASSASAMSEAMAAGPETDESGTAMQELTAELARWTEALNLKLEKHRADYEMSFAELECELESVGNVALSVHDEGSRLANVCQDLLNRLSCGTQLNKWQIRRAHVLRVAHVCSRGAEIAERWRPAEPGPDTTPGYEDKDATRAADSQGGAGSPPPDPRGYPRPGGERPADPGAEEADDAEGSEGLGNVLEGAVVAAGSAESVELGECESLFQLLCSPSRELSYGPWPFRLLDFPALGAAEEPLVVSNCLTLADSQWLRRRAAGGASPSRLSDVRRLAPLVRLSRGTRLRRTRRGAAGALPCGMFRVLGPRPELLFLVEFEYEPAGDAAGPAPAAAWWRDARPPAAVKHPVLDEALLARCVACSDWARLTTVTLAGRCIKVLGELPVLPNVVQLDLSYNQLASLGSLYAFPNLRSLNLAFNNFVTLVNMRDLPFLESLNLSWNNVRHLLVVLKALSKHTAGLRCLQVCHNPVEDVLEAAHGRHLAARYLPRLAALDGDPVCATPIFLQPPPGMVTPASSSSATAPPRPASCQPLGRGPGRPNARPASGSLSPRRPPRVPAPAVDRPGEQPPGRRHGSTDDLRLRWRADRGDQAVGSDAAVLPDRFTLSARGRGLTHVLDPGLAPPTASWTGLPATATPSPATGAWLAAVRWADLSDNVIGEVGLTQALAAMPHLVQLNASRNAIEGLSMACFQPCPGLQKLDLSRNYLRAFPLLSLKPLLQLQFLDLSCNQLQLLSGLEEMLQLRELYLANNHVRTLQDLHPLRKLQRLCVLDMTGNDVCDDPNFKKFVIFHLRNLESVNGQEVVDGDLVAARETFGGCLDRDALLTHYTWRDATHLVELHLPGASLRQDAGRRAARSPLMGPTGSASSARHELPVDLPARLLPHLEVLDLSHNGLDRLWGLQLLPRLAVLDLGHNQVRCLGGPGGAEVELRPRCEEAGDVEAMAKHQDYDSLPRPRPGFEAGDSETDTRLFPALHTLYLDSNGLSRLEPLALGRLLHLETLFLQHNQLDSLAGLGHELRGLVLDGNLLNEAALGAAAETGSLRSLYDLHLDCNALQGLGFLSGAPNMTRLFVARNKIADQVELESLRLAPHLTELSLLGNPVCLRPRHYAAVHALLPRLALFDGHSMDAACYLCPTSSTLSLGLTPTQPNLLEADTEIKE